MDSRSLIHGLAVNTTTTTATAAVTDVANDRGNQPFSPKGIRRDRCGSIKIVTFDSFFLLLFL